MANPPTIAEGATGPTVRWAQYLLVRRTLSYNQIDGIFGAVTKTAVEQFQRDSHLAVDGVVGPATWGALGGGHALPPTLAQGSQGPVVEKLQTALKRAGASSHRSLTRCSPSTASTASTPACARSSNPANRAAPATSRATSPSGSASPCARRCHSRPGMSPDASRPRAFSSSPVTPIR